MSTPLIDGLEKYISEKNIRFHMPGHKGKSELSNLTKLLPELDVTEIPGVDNLHNPNSIIKKSQENASKVFGAKETFYCVNGTTGGIYASIVSQTKEGDTVLVQRDSHKSVYQALVFGRLNVEYTYPSYDTENNMLLGLDPKEIEQKLKNNKNIKVVVVTYPSYYGVCSDIEAISDIVHKYSRILIVDEAHGSHLAFHDSLPKSALQSGADIVIQSTHKTLLGFTQSSMVHVGTESVDVEKLKLNMSIFQTTSPSYILLSSLDYTVDYVDKFAHELLDKILDKIKEITIYLDNVEGVKIYNKNNMTSLSYDFDITKLLFKIDGITGRRLEEILREDYNIQVEMSDYYYCLALISILDEADDLEKLKTAIEDISKRAEYKEVIPKIFNDIRVIKPKITLPIYKAFYSDKISVQLNKSIGEISGEFIIPYPPGIPVLAPGEEITSDIVNYIEVIKREKIEILSVTEDLREIKIIDAGNY